MARTLDQLTAIIADALKDGKRGQTGAGGRIVKSATVVAGTTKATLDTGVVGSDNALTWTAVTGGTGGNSITIELEDPAGNNVSLACNVTDNAIKVTLATDGSSNPTSTADQVKDIVAATPAAAALVTVADKGVSNGSGVCAAVAPTALAGGTAAGGDVVQVKFQDEGVVVTKTLTLS